MKLKAQLMQTLSEAQAPRVGVAAAAREAAARETASQSGCPLCGRMGHQIVHLLEPVEIRRCGECGFVFARGGAQNASEEGYYDSMGGYEPFLEAKKREWYELFRDLAMRTPGRRLLEVGCARGDALAMARQFGWLPCGVEVSRDDAAYARSEFGLVVHHGTVETCPFEEGSFDAALMWSVIEHIADPLPALRACRRLLKPGGLLSIHTPNADSKVARDLGPRWSMYHVPGHVSFFSPSTMRMALRKSGLEPVQLETGLGSRPVNIDPKARMQFSPRRVASYVATRLGLKEPLREMIYAMQPKLREQGEFMAVVAKRNEE